MSILLLELIEEVLLQQELNQLVRDGLQVVPFHQTDPDLLNMARLSMETD